MRLRPHRSMRRTAALVAGLALAVGSTGIGTAQAADTVTTPQPRVGEVTLGQACVGNFGSIFTFTITANAAVPAGSSWDLTVTASDGFSQLRAVSDSPLVQGLPTSMTQVHLTAPTGIPAGTTVGIQPSNFFIPATTGTSVSLSGLGGSTTASYTTSARPC